MSLNPIPVQLKKLREGAIVPEYKSAAAAAFDLHALIPKGEVFYIKPGETRKVPTGIAIFLNNPDVALYIWERSGLGSQGIEVRGGLVDPDYQGECVVMLTNGTSEFFYIKDGDRIGQAVVAPVLHAKFEVVSEFTVKTERGEKGFGSSGVSQATEPALEAA